MSAKESLHEDLGRDTRVKQGSDRSFGVVFAVVFCLIGLAPLVSGAGVRVWALAGAGVFALLAAVAPALLGPLNRVWALVGLLLHKVTNPIIMGVLFFGVFTPTALLMKLIGRDALHLGLDAKADSYWILRKPPGPEPSTMTNQY